MISDIDNITANFMLYNYSDVLSQGSTPLYVIYRIAFAYQKASHHVGRKLEILKKYKSPIVNIDILIKAFPLLMMKLQYIPLKDGVTQSGSNDHPNKSSFFESN